FWVPLSGPAQTGHLVPSGLDGPNGARSLTSHRPAISSWPSSTARIRKLHVALNLARPWRALARHGQIYRDRQVSDPRSVDRTAI
ncbi:carbon-nitrogen hydrolase family protein, partial [Actinoplanes sp. ATCC 53533]